jgi:protein-arginine kinase activator protein McsA
MNCDNCGNDVAVVHLTQVVEGRKSERHLCLKCASMETGGSGGDIREMLAAWMERQKGQAGPGE